MLRCELLFIYLINILVLQSTLLLCPDPREPDSVPLTQSPKHNFPFHTSALMLSQVSAISDVLNVPQGLTANFAYSCVNVPDVSIKSAFCI